MIDATCPFVTAAQEKAARLKDDGYLVVILGERDHPEVLGTAFLRGRRLPRGRVAGRPAGEAAEPAGRRGGADHAVAGTSVGARGSSRPVMAKELLVHNTICSATEQRQAAAIAMASDVDAVVVVGGRDSGNTRRLAELCAAQQPNTHHVESADEIDPEWFRGARTVGDNRRRLHAS